MQLSKTNTRLIIDIGSASVSGALVSVSKHGVPELTDVFRSPIGKGSGETRKALEPLMLTALDELMKHYQTHKGSVRVVVASPWYDAQVRFITSKSEKAVFASEGTIEKTVERYQNEKPPRSGNVDIEAIAMQVKVNGYPTALLNPVKGTRLGIHLYESEMKQDLYTKIQDTVGKTLPHARISFSTFPLVSGVSLREILDEDSFIYVDVTGEVTDISIVHNDGLQYLASIPVGYQNILRTIGGDQIGDASSRLSLLTRGELTVDQEATLRPQFEKAFAEWQTQFEEVLHTASEKVPIPGSLYVVSDKEPVKWIISGIESWGSMQLSPKAITSSMVQKFISVGENGQFDVFLALSALFFHMGEEEVVGEEKPRAVVYSRQ